MPRYRIHRIKDSQKEHFRWAPHTGGLAIVKAKDYDPGDEVESASPYTLWKELVSDEKHTCAPLSPGDLLETIDSEDPSSLLIAKYIGFEPAQWFVSELKTSATTADAVSSTCVPELTK